VSAAAGRQSSRFFFGRVHHTMKAAIASAINPSRMKIQNPLAMCVAAVGLPYVPSREALDCPADAP
jgi:hypothetical protein